MTITALTFAQRFEIYSSSMERGGMSIRVLRIDMASSADTENLDAEPNGTYGLFFADTHVKFADYEKFGYDVFAQMYHEGEPVALGITYRRIPSPARLARV